MKRSILRWLHQVFDARWSLGRRDAETVEDAWRTIATSEYDVAGSWFDRLAHGVALRTTDRLVDMVNESVQLENDMQVIDRLAMQRTARRRVGRERFLQRFTEAEIAAVFSVPNRWEPVLIEPRGGERAVGYLPLKPMFTSGSHINVSDWSRADGYAANFPGSIEDWRRKAEASGCGLMLFPMTPVEHALRRRYN